MFGSLALNLACNIVSGISCLIAALIITIFKGGSKAQFRLEIGLCCAFGVTHILSFILLFSFFEFEAHHHVPFIIGYCIRITTLGASLHYLIAIYTNYWLKSRGWSEERIMKKETIFHILAWIPSSLYSLFIFFHNRASLIVSFVILGIQGLYIIFCSLAVYTRQKRDFSSNSEVLSPLVTARSRKNLNSFFRRLLVLTFISLLIFAQALLYFPMVNKFVNKETRTQYVTEIFPLDGFVISLLLTTAPSLIAAYKQRYHKFRQSYEPIPRSPFIDVEAFSPKSPPKVNINNFVPLKLSQ